MVMKWAAGRQGTGYEKLKLFELRWPVKTDAYILRFDKGVGVTPHTDPVRDGRHYRMNITLVKPKYGATFMCRRKIVDWWRVVVFRPDVEEHSMTPAMCGPLYLLSVGWVVGAKR